MNKFKKILKVSSYFVFGLIILIVIASSIYNRIGNSRVKGEIKGLGTRLALVSGETASNNKSFLKVLLVFNDKFSFKVNINESGRGRIITKNMFFERVSGKPLWMRSKMISFYISPNQTISIKGSMDDYSINYLIKGNKLAEHSTKFRQENIGILEEETELYLIIDSLKYFGNNESAIDSLNERFDRTRETYNNQRLKYVVRHPSNEVSAYFLEMQRKDTILKYYPLLSEYALANFFGKRLKERVNVYSKTKVGNFAPNFIDAGVFRLEDFKGKYVVLDFWGTWCGACRKGLPKMRKYYKKYKSRIEFIGIACNDEQSTWEKYIKDEELEWTQLLNNEQNNDLAKKYAVRSFPTKVLIDPRGKIIIIFEGEGNDFYEKLNSLMNK
jgi:thiol-disulfide isomerase/thioredoxin